MILQELRFVSPEVGGLAEARRMPREVRHWWIGEITKDRKARSDEADVMRGKQRVDI